MDWFIERIQNDVSNAFFFLLPLAGSILYFQFRTKTDNNPFRNLLLSFLGTTGLTASVIAICGAAYSLLFAVGLFRSASASQVVAVGIVVAFLAVIYSSLERQYLQHKRIEQLAVEQTRRQMIASVARVTPTARTEVLMFCGTMSFIARDYDQFARLKASHCRVRALCAKSDSPEVLQRYELARSLGIEIKFYPDDELEPGIRGRIIDPNSFDNAAAVLISKQLDTPGAVKYLATLLIGNRHTLEMTLLNSLFRTLWVVSDEK